MTIPPTDAEILETVGAYKPGSITRVKLHNFLTYQDVEFKPGPRLNMVVGANGTGKSTILNAICLGLGGEPKLLGRADDARGFIMNGKDNAVMELELAPLPGSETHVLRREIDRNKGSEKGRGRGASTFYINNEHCTIKEVKELVTEHYNIQIDNLCTFLPQDKVGSFSGFDAQQLLLETEKTLSPSQHLYKLHQELIQLESELANGFGDEDDVRDKLKKFEHECAQLEREKDRMQEREKALEQADLLQKKQVWLQFEALRDQALALKGQKSKIKEELKTAQASIQPLEEQAENLAAQKKELEDKFKKLDQTTQRCQQDMAKQKTKFEEHDDKTETIIAEIRELDSKRDNLEENLQRAHDKIDKLKDMEKEFTATPEQVDTELADATEKRRAVHSDYGKAKRDVRDCSDKMQDLESRAGSFQRKLADMNDESARRRERIFRQDPNLGKIHEWVEGNRSVFRHRVWGPIAVEVSTKSQNASAFLEQHVPNWCLKAFVVESKEDYDILWNEIRTKRKIPINIVTVENGRLEQVSRMYSDQKMLILKRDHGVIGYLDDSFTAPDTVMQALRVQASVHKVLVGGEKTQASMDNKGLLDYLTELEGSHGQNSPQNSVTFTSKGQQSFKYTQTLSRYSGKASTRIDDVGPARLLAPGVNERAKKDVEDQLRAVHEEIAAVRPDSQVADKKKNVLEVELQNLSRRVEAAKAMKQNLAHYRSKLETANHKLKDAEAALDVDDDAEKKKLIKTLMSRVAASITALEIQAAQHKKIIQSTISSAGIGVTKSGLAGAERQARQFLEETRAEFNELEQRALQIQQSFAAVKKRAAETKKEAETNAPLQDTSGNALPLKAQLEELDVQTLHDVEAALEEAIQKADSIVANPDVIRQYADLKEMIESTRADLEEMTSSKDKQVAAIDDKLKPWEAALSNSVAKINSLFTKYMCIMGCTGEVGLIKGKTSDTQQENGNFKDWGIEIRVSFRENTKAQVLSAHVQSGGERSVSTIMYLMALQERMVAPFRCVDEINQGLDERNERLVFSRIVENSTRKPKDDPTDHSGQYFLITPKLLPNLVAMEVEAMTVLFVFNGPYNFKSPTEWNVDRLLDFRKKRAITNGAADDENSGNSVPRKASKKRKSN